jgi:predicted Zn-ribbon and HTH transcriptional regulator
LRRDDISEIREQIVELSSLMEADMISAMTDADTTGVASKKDASTQTVSNPTQLERSEHSKAKQNHTRRRRCRKCGFNKLHDKWSVWHPSDRSRRGHFYRCETPDEEREKRFPLPEDQRMPNPRPKKKQATMNHLLERVIFDVPDINSVDISYIEGNSMREAEE